MPYHPHGPELPTRITSMDRDVEVDLQGAKRGKITSELLLKPSQRRVETLRRVISVEVVSNLPGEVEKGTILVSSVKKPLGSGRRKGLDELAEGQYSLPSLLHIPGGPS